jgi:hypothetical protein
MRTPFVCSIVLGFSCYLLLLCHSLQQRCCRDCHLGFSLVKKLSARNPAENSIKSKSKECKGFFIHMNNETWSFFSFVKPWKLEWKVLSAIYCSTSSFLTGNVKILKWNFSYFKSLIEFAAKSSKLCHCASTFLVSSENFDERKCN